MPGLYEVPVRAPGTLISALIYNSDHQNHVDGRDAEFVQSLGASVSQFNLTEAPTVAGDPSLAPSLAGEITRLRYKVGEFKKFMAGNTTVSWYAPIDAVAPLTIGALVQRSTSQAILTGTNTKIDFTGGTATFNNPNTIWTSGSNQTRFTAPFDGLYFAFASICWAGVGAVQLNKARRIQLGVNNTFSANPVVSDVVHSTPPADVHCQTVTGFLDLTTADFVEYRVFQDTGLTINLIAQAEQSIVGGLVFLGSHP